jgi:hypothetical protein
MGISVSLNVVLNRCLTIADRMHFEQGKAAARERETPLQR